MTIGLGILVLHSQDSPPSCPALCRASTSYARSTTWMAGPTPAMTRIGSSFYLETSTMGIRLVIAGLALASCGGALAQSMPKVMVGDNPSLSGAPLYIAIEKGYYRDAGVDVQ